MKSESRKQRRRPLNYVASIEHSDGSTIECWLSDVSQSGAKIGVESPDAIPNSFTLLLAGPLGSRRQCRVIWRESGHIGVQFMRPQYPSHAPSADHNGHGSSDAPAPGKAGGAVLLNS